MQNRRGIYTLANDAVFDQLVALLNSIEANYGGDVSVCVIPYDDKVGMVRDEIAKRPQVMLFNDVGSIMRREEFAKQAWGIVQMAKDMACSEKAWGMGHGVWGRHKLGVHRKLCSFDGPFEKFIFLDADTLVMKPLDFIYEELDKTDVVVYDYQYKDASHVYNMTSPRLPQVFPKDRIDAEIFCTGFFASRRGLFDDSKRELILSGLKEGDAEILYPNAPEQSLLNYMVMKTKARVHNFALSFPASARIGNAVTSTHFEAKDNILYDKGNCLAYLHYIGITAAPFCRLCAGENIGFPYRDIFLHYRYLHEPEKRPVLRGKAVPYNKTSSLFQRIWNKVAKYSRH